MSTFLIPIQVRMQWRRIPMAPQFSILTLFGWLIEYIWNPHLFIKYFLTEAKLLSLSIM